MNSTPSNEVIRAKKKSPYNLTVFVEVIKNGLFLQGVRHIFAKIGIDIMPYYWVQEEVTSIPEPKLRTNQTFIFKSLKKDDLIDILEDVDSLTEKKIHQSFAAEQECVGLIDEGQIAAYMFIELNNFQMKNRKFKLGTSEAYLLNMFTLKRYRGKNLAPYLRYACYRHLEKKQINTKYSISNYFNNSAIKFKKKLNSKPQKLFLNIELFKSNQWNFLLKTYK